MRQASLSRSVLICALGDSRTYGAGATLGCDPMTLLIEKLRQYRPRIQFACDNQAVNGTSLRFWAQDQRLDDVFATFRQSALAITDETQVFVQVMLGVNDSCADQRLSADDFSRLMQQLIDRTLDANIPGFSGIVLHASYYTVPGKFSAAFDEESIELVQRYNALLPSFERQAKVLLGDLQAYEYFANRPELLYDGLHAGNDGNAALATLWAQAYENIFIGAPSR
jgi:lysophospholipase L1-like esterase